MGCYHIWLSEDSSNLCTIILLWINTITTVYEWELETHQSISNIKWTTFPRFWIYTYVYRQPFDSEIFYWTDNIEKMELTLNTLKESGIKLNIELYLFGQIEMDYLGF